MSAWPGSHALETSPASALPSFRDLCRAAYPQWSPQLSGGSVGALPSGSTSSTTLAPCGSQPADSYKLSSANIRPHTASLHGRCFGRRCTRNPLLRPLPGSNCSATPPSLPCWSSSGRTECNPPLNSLHGTQDGCS
eukprot:6810325-Heterocapsa_arctica.AAC.1